MSNTDMNNIDPYRIVSTGDKMRSDEEIKIQAEVCLEQIRKNIRYEDLLITHSTEQEQIDGIVDLIRETLMMKGDHILIASNQYPTEIVRSKLLKLNYSHIDYVLFCMRTNTTQIKNIKKYLLAALFNAPSTMEGYFKAAVNYDLQGAHPVYPSKSTHELV